MDAVNAIAALQLFGQAVPDLWRRRQTGDQDDVGAALKPVHPDMEPAGLEVGMGMAMCGMPVMRVILSHRRGSASQGQGSAGTEGQGLCQDLHGVVSKGRARKALLMVSRRSTLDRMQADRGSRRNLSGPL